MDLLEKLVAAWTAIDSRITASRAVMWACIALVGVGLVQVYETRATSIPAIFGTVYGWAAGGLAVVAGLIAWTGSILTKNFEARQQDLEEQQAELRKYLESRISELTHDRESCKDELDKVRDRLTRAEQVLRDNDLDLDPTK